MTTNLTEAQRLHRPSLEHVERLIAKRSFCALATSSPAGRAHVAGMLYQAVARDTRNPQILYLNTTLTSRKARNIAANPYVAVNIPVRRLPMGPPAAIQFQGVAELVSQDDPGLLRLVEAGKLSSITSHGELDKPGGGFVRITPARRLNTYGIGMSLLRFLKDPLHAAGAVELPEIR
ncbi:pyridoxamine 5'-phosphate oxidase family protein [Saccharomonospora sp. NPDC006951]